MSEPFLPFGPEGATREEVETRFREQYGRDLHPGSLEKMVEAGYLDLRDGRYYGNAQGRRAAAEINAYKNAVSEVLHEDYVLDSGRQVAGNSLSFVISNMRFRGLKAPSRYGDQTDILDRLGFSVQRGRSRRGRACEVVFKKVLDH